MSLDVELRLLAACLFMHPSAFLNRGSPRRLASDPFNRCPDICRSIGIGRGILFLRSTRVTSAHVDERDSIFAMFARPRRWSLAQQRARRARSPLQSQIRFHAHTQVRHRTQITTVADLQIQASNRRSRSPSWLSRFISPTSCGSQLFTSSSSQYRSCSCSRVVSFMFVYLRWPLAGQRSVLAAHGRAPQFPRDKIQIVE